MNRHETSIDNYGGLVERRGIPSCDAVAAELQKLVPPREWFADLLSTVPPDAKSLTLVDPYEGEYEIRFEPIEEQPEP